MKKLIILICLAAFSFGLFAQNGWDNVRKKEHFKDSTFFTKTVIANGGVKIGNTVEKTGVNKTGSLLLTQDSVTTDNVTTPTLIKSYRGGTLLSTNNEIILTSALQTSMRTSAWWVANARYELRDSVNLGGTTVTLPVGVKLRFNGGKLTNGVLVGNHASFECNNNTQIFDTSLTCSGTWQTTNITPQNYGAITVDTNTVYTYDCSPAFRACLNSIFNVKVPAGWYYIKNTIYARKPKIVDCGNEGLVSNIDSPTTFDGAPNHVRLFSNANIDYVVIQIDRFYWLGGTFDSETVAHHTKCFFRYDYDGYLGVVLKGWGGALRFNAFGNKTALKADQNGTTAVWMNGDAATLNYGYVCDVQISGYWVWMNKGLVIDADDWVTHSTWTNSITTNLVMDGVRQALYIDASYYSVFKVEVQTREVLSAANAELVCMYFGNLTSNNQIDIIAVDFSGLGAAGLYRAKYAIKDNGLHNNYTGNTQYSLSNGQIGTTGQFIKKELYSYGTGGTKNQITNYGAYRQTKGLTPGEMFFDTYLNIPIWWNGVSWVKADGTAASSVAWYGALLTDGLSAYWKLDETASPFADATANANTATGSGGYTANQTGILNKCVQFDGTNGCLTITQSASLTFSAVDFSVSAWVYFTGTANGSVIGGTGNADPFLMVSNSNLTLYGGSQGYVDWIHSDSAITKNAWHHIVWVHDSTGTDASNNWYYIDGTWAGNVKPWATDDHFSSLANIIRIGLGNSVYWKGYIDEVGVWKRMLTIDEIKRLYNHGIPLPYASFGTYTW